MSQQDFSFTLWDVDHGLCVWIQPPNGQNHWNDCKKSEVFSPPEHVKKKHAITKLDYLIISSPDTDHINDLPNLVKNLGRPGFLSRNRILPDSEKGKSGSLKCQAYYKDLDSTYPAETKPEEKLHNLEANGGSNLNR
jgi:competence protein ComEC